MFGFFKRNKVVEPPVSQSEFMEQDDSHKMLLHENEADTKSHVFDTAEELKQAAKGYKKDGLSVKQIADRLHRSESQVRRYLRDNKNGK